MIRFLAIASIMRGAIDPPEVLESADQERALARLEHDELGQHGEIVLWYKGQPYVADLKARKLPEMDKTPKISADLRGALQSAPTRFDESNDRRRLARG